MAGPIATAYVDVKADTSKFEREAQHGIGGSLTKLAGLATAAFAGIGAVHFFRDAASDAADANAMFRQTNSIIEATGGVAGVTQGQVTDLANSLQFKIGVDDEDIRSVSNELLTFRNVSSDIFNEATADAFDMAAVMGTDASSAALQLGKALNDPTKGIAALSRAGVTFTQEQKDQIKAMQASGDMAGAQRIILDELAHEFSGAAEAGATAGQKIATMWGEAKESLGQGLVAALDKVAPALLTTLTQLQAPMEALGQSLGDAMGPLFEAIGPAIVTAVDALAPVFTDIGGIIGDLAPLIEPVIGVLGTLAGIVSGALGAAFHALAPAIEVVGGFIRQFGAVIGRSLMPLISRLAPVLDQLGAIFSGVLAAVLPTIIDLVQALMGAFAEIAEAVLPVLVDMFAELAPVLTEIADVLAGAIIDALPDLVSAFKAITKTLLPLVPLLAKGFLAALVALAPILPQIIQGFVALKAATAAFSMVMKVLNVIMALNPFTLIVVAIAALAAGVYIAYNRFQGFHDVVDKAWQILQSVWDTVVRLGSQFGEFALLLLGPIGALALLYEKFQWFRDAVSGFIDTVKLLFQGKWGEAWTAFKDTAINLAEVLIGYLKGLGGLLVGALGDLGGLLLSKGHDLLNGLWQGAQSLWDSTILPWFKKLPGYILTGLSAAGSLLLSVGSDLVNAIWQGAQALWDDPVLPWFKSLPGLVVAGLKIIGSGLLERGTSLLRAIWTGITGFWDGTLEPWLVSLPGLMVSAIKVAGSGLLDRGTSILRQVWSGVTNFWTDTLEPWFANLPMLIIGAVKVAGGSLLRRGEAILSQIWTGVTGFWTSTLEPWFADLPMKVIGAIKVAGGELLRRGEAILTQIYNGVTGFWTGTVAPWFADLPMKVIGAIKVAGGSLLRRGEAILGQILDGITGFWTSDIEPWFHDLPGNIASALKVGGGALLARGGDIVDELLDGVRNFWKTGGLKKWFQDLPGNIGKAVTGAISDIKQSAIDLAQGWWDAFTGWIEPLIQTFADLLDVGLGPLINIGDNLFGDPAPAANAAVDDLFNAFHNAIDTHETPALDQAFSNVLVYLAEHGATAGANALTAKWGEVMSNGVITQAEAAELEAMISEQMGKVGEAGGAAVGGGFGRSRRLFTGKEEAEFAKMPEVFGGAFSKAAPKAMQAPSETLMDALRSAVEGGLKHSAKVMADAPKGFANELAKNKDALGPPGTSMIEGMKTAMDTATSAVRVLLVGLSARFVQWLGSTATVFTAAGTMLMSGLVNGMASGQVLVSTTLVVLRSRFAGWLGDLSSLFISAGLSLMNGLVTGIAYGWGGVAGWLSGIPLRIVGTVGNLGGLLFSAGWVLMNSLTDGIAVGWGGVHGWLSGVPLRIAGAIGYLGSILNTPGAQLMNGLRDGIIWGGAGAIQAAQNVANMVAAVTKSALRIHSPSKVFEGIGLNTMLGFQQGIESGVAGLAGIFGGLGDSVTPIPTAAGAGAGVTFGPGAVQVMFAGALPTDSQAFSTGLQVGKGIESALARQRVRTLARTSRIN